MLGGTKAGPGTAARKDLSGPHGQEQKGDLVVAIVRGHHLGCILKAEQEEREEAGRGDPKIRGRKQKTLPPWVTEPHPRARQG